MLIDRGEQYQRGIQLYFRKFKRFPADLDQLENTNNFRFLRRRYRDPITGKDEWRLIHIGPGGMLTDSLTQKPAQAKKEDNAAEEAAKAGGQELPSAATRRRASEGGVSPPGTGPGEGTAEPGAQPAGGEEGQVAGLPPTYGAQAPWQPGQPYPPPPPEPNPEPQVGEPYVIPGQRASQPSTYPPPQPFQPGSLPYPMVQPGQSYPPGQIPQLSGYPQVQPYQPQAPIRVYTGQPGQPSPVQIIPGLPSPYGRAGGFVPTFPPPRPPSSSQTGGEPPMPYPTTVLGPPAPPYPSYSPYQGQPPPGAGGPSNPALEMIRKILTTPRPGGLGQNQIQETFTYGAGVAGVASKAEGDSIIIYNERSRYNEWEFIYDLRKDRTMVGPVGPAGTPPGNLLKSSSQGSTSSTLSPTGPPAGPGGRGR
jgi:hypothetical protein